MYNLSRLYLITDRKQCDDILFVVEEALRAGVRLVQLREKDLSSKAIYELALDMRKLTVKYSALFLINDRVDIALAVGADGVHIGKNSMSVSMTKKLAFGKDFIVGYSTHSVEEAFWRESQGVDFITISPIFTPSNKCYKAKPIGKDILEKLSSLSVPVYALGGINADNISGLGNAYGIALISEVIAADDPCAKVRELFSIISNTFPV